MQLREPLGECETDAESTVHAPRSFLLLLEHLEDLRQERRLDPLARVPDAGDRCVALPLEDHAHETPLRCELDRIGDEVRKHLVKPVRVAPDDEAAVGELDLETDRLRPRLAAHRVHAGAHQLDQVDGAWLERDLATRDRGQIEQLVDERSGRVGCAAEDLDPGHDGREWRAQLM